MAFEKAPTPGSRILKWIVIPAALALLGYYFVGPQIGALRDPRPHTSQSEGDFPGRTVDGDEADKRLPEPEVEVFTRRAPRRAPVRATPPPANQDAPSAPEEPPMPVEGEPPVDQIPPDVPPMSVDASDSGDGEEPLRVGGGESRAVSGRDS